MPLRPCKDRVEVSATKLLVYSMFSVILCVGSAVRVRAQDAQPNKTDGLWTATAQTSIDHANPSRTLESHSKSDNLSVDKQRVEVLGSDGGYQPYYDTPNVPGMADDGKLHLTERSTSTQNKEADKKTSEQ